MLSPTLKMRGDSPARRPEMPAFAAARGAVAALEFGILAPVMALLLIAVFNLAKIAVLWEQIWSASRSIAESASTLAIQSDGSASLTYTQADLALSAVYAEIPWVAAGIATGNYTSTGNLPPDTMTVVLTSVDFHPSVAGCQTDCAYTSNVVFSKAYVPPNSYSGFNYSSSVLHTCGEPLGSETIINSIMAAYKGDNINVPDPFLMAEVKINFTPYLFNIFTGKVTLKAITYIPVRSDNPSAADQAATLTPDGDPNPSVQCSITNQTG